MVVVSFLVLYRYSIKPQHSVYLSKFWARDFPPYDKPLTIPIWLASEVYALCDHPYRSFGPLFLLMALAGVWGFIRARQTRLLAACLLPLALAVVAACFRQYPFNGDRVTIYLVPGLFLLCGGSLILLRDSLSNAAAPLRLAWLIVAGIVIGRGGVEAAYRLAEPRSRSGVRPVVAWLREHRQPGEAIYFVGEEPHFRSGLFNSKLCVEALCYWHYPPQPAYRGLPVDVAEVATSHFWVIFASLPHSASKDAGPLAKQLHPVAAEISRYIPPGGGGAAFLFEKRNPDRLQ